ncbi:uncharacterized protein LOC113508942 isoform X2 [Trichoplusia ni]|uniref:Uncharacterized protein LOC113508942 isoform X2 n=1 Tax=Trichoplusia ni TaxID=7111 RepID=A0A7E5X5X2_TRINI|nr:uncharacterized protein LOC113508942 isoform X2 [Trichoplusia ni]
MSDKSFGDCPSRNIVKNPLLSTAVTGLSIEDLTHNAVLVPVAANQALITRSEHIIGSTAHTLDHSDHEFTNFPSGDSNTSVLQGTYLDQHEKKEPSTTVSKVLKSDDDFDVNEYFARLQGTRYVSAPINSQADQNANLAETEDNLEEINLNEDKNEVQQSLTADIAQNFSQLPTVLPHVASAVFSSFSNMLSYKSREQTPDERYQGYQDTYGAPGQGFQAMDIPVAPVMAEEVKEVAPPPKEPPIGGTTNYRITTRKKYAQIPGLSSGHNTDNVQQLAFNPHTQNVPSYFVPTPEDNNQNIYKPLDNLAQQIKPIEQGIPNIQETYNINQVDSVKASDNQPNAFNVTKDNAPNSFEEKLPPAPFVFQDNARNTIPPPPMFSSQKKESTAAKSVLPPSVARRIGSNQPVIKAPTIQANVTENILVPTFDPTAFSTETSQPNDPLQIGSQMYVTNPPSYPAQVQEKQALTNIPSIPPPGQFMPTPPPGFGSSAPPSVIVPPTAPQKLPPQTLPPINMPSTNIAAPPMFAPTSQVPSSIFAPSSIPIDAPSSVIETSKPPLSNIFSPPMVAAQLPPVAAIPPNTGPPNIGPTLFNPPSNTNIAPPYFNPAAITEPTPESFTGPPKPLAEPPKATEGVNFRMIKKRPQYYSGPIEGVGSISNSIKPVIQPVESGTFQGAMFTPEPPKVEQNVPLTPFDISKPIETVPLMPTFNESSSSINVQPSTFDLTQPPAYPQYDITKPIQNYEYNTAFDMSRPTTETYERKEEQQESKGFGIIGSLKSKLSSIDINKIQHSVTTFFDPAYNGTKKDDAIAPKNEPYAPLQPQGNVNNFEIFVPSVHPNQTYNYEQHQQAIHATEQYYRYPNFQNQGQPSAMHCSNYNHYPNQQNTYANVETPMNTASVPTNVEGNTPRMCEVLYSEPIPPPKIEPSKEAIAKPNEGTTFEPEATKVIHNVTTIEEKSAISFFELDSFNKQSILVPEYKTDQPIPKPIGSQVTQDSQKDLNLTTDKIELLKSEKIASIFEPKVKPDLFAKDKVLDSQENKFKTVDMFASTSFSKPNISDCGAQSIDLFSNTKPKEPIEEKADMLFATLPVENKVEDVKTDVFSSTMFKDEVAVKDNILEYLKKDDVPILGVSSVPLFGLSTIVPDKSLEFITADSHALATKHSSMSFFDHPHKPEECPAPKHIEMLNNTSSFSFFENVANIPSKDGEKTGKTDVQDKGKDKLELKDDLKKDNEFNSPGKESTEEKDQSQTEKTDKDNPDDENELNICETCREVNQTDDEDDGQDVTNQLIENITAPIQLSNPVEAVLTEASSTGPSTTQIALDAKQFDEISHITEETIETIQVQSATELLEDVDEIKAMNYGWTEDLLKQDYTFNMDPNSMGFFGTNSLFFDKVPTKAEEIKHHEDLLTRTLNPPSAPPEEEDTKSDPGILDVHSIEQDANKDFPLFEEFVIEPSENDDDGDFKKSEDRDEDSFTNRVEKYKQMEPNEGSKSLFFDAPPQTIGMASYFDTGNFAADNHYRITKTGNNAPTIPPGFEEEFRKRLALAKLKEEQQLADINKERQIPDTSTQTRTTTVVSYSTAQAVPTYSSPQAIGFNVEANVTKLVEEQNDDEEPTVATPIPEPAKPAALTKEEIKPELKLPDPKNFFADDTPAKTDTAPESFSRLASYFSSPPKTDHAKSFFELSQSQNHYRHASIENKYTDLIKDLTSVQNLAAPKDQTIRHVNYFTVEYDSVLPELNKGDNSKEKPDLLENDDKFDIDSLVNNCMYCAKIFDTTFKVRTATNENSEQSANIPNMDANKVEPGRGSVTVNFDGSTIQEEPNEGVAGLTENRASTEYTPVKHHWFYRVDVEDKSIWRGFSVIDSRALETAYLSPELDDQTLVPTDGGRYDVNVVGRLRIPVYWSDKPTNVRRCSWFYKGATDARYVPYTEPTAEKLEEEYRHGMTTGEWHRRLVLPNGEVVVMHGPSVMVHFLHSDAFSTPPQSTSRPRVVRRGHDESEIEDTEPSSIDHLLLLCHGVGSACDMRFRSVEEVVEDFRATSLQLIQSHYRNSFDQGVVSRVEVLPISWHATLHSGETGVDRRLAQITLDSIPRLRNFTNDTVLDVLFYTSPVFCQTIIDTVCKELNRIYNLFVQRNPSFKGGVSLGGHSLGSVILYDLLCHQAEVSSTVPLSADKHYVSGSAGTGQLCVRYPCLAFSPDALYALGSPIAIFECIRGVESLGASFKLPTCKNFFNIFHPYDPIAYRIEPLIDPRLRELKPFLIPHHKGRKRMHLELKDTMARVGADLKQKLLESLKSTWNKWKAPPPTDGQLEKVVEEEIEKEHLCEDSKEELANESELSTPEMLGRLNGGRRVDYVLQEAPLEMINEYIFAMSSHVGYWESEDTMLLMLREIYSALGVQPDSTVPQQNMTVQRTRTAKPDETIVIGHASGLLYRKRKLITTLMCCPTVGAITEAVNNTSL